MFPRYYMMQAQQQSWPRRTGFGELTAEEQAMIDNAPLFHGYIVRDTPTTSTTGDFLKKNGVYLGIGAAAFFLILMMGRR